MHSLVRHVRTVSTRVPIKRTVSFVDTLLKQTDDPLWRNLLGVRQPTGTFAAAKAAIPDYERWHPVTRLIGVTKALEDLKGESVPLWLAFYLLVFRVRTHEDAYPAGFDLAYAHLPSAPKHLHGPLLIFTAASLTRFNLLLPMRRVIDSFIAADLSPHPELYFNLFLQALTISPTKSTENAQAIVKLIRLMEARKLGLDQETYDLLLNDEVANIHLAHFLRYRMTRHGIVPTTTQLEAYLRVFAKEGSSKEVEDTRSAIQERATLSTDTLREEARLSIKRSNKILLGRRADREAVIEYLAKLLNPRYRAKPKPFNLKNLDLNAQKPLILPRKSAPDIYSVTATLFNKANDRTTPSKELIELFEKIRARRDLDPSQVTYTVLLRGLYDRGRWKWAMKYWDEFYESGMAIDRQSLAIGIKILTRSGRPHQAFALLQERAYRLNLSDYKVVEPEDEDESSEIEEATDTTVTEQKKTLSPFMDRVSVSVIMLNDWLVALNRISRPDIVLAVWDAYRPMYNITPDARTLTLLLQAIRRVRHLDGTSIQGVAVRIKYDIRDTLGINHPSSPQEISADDAQRNLEALLGPPDADIPNPYKPSLWHGRLPFDHARLLFLQAVFGVAPDPKALMDVEPPARATRKKAPSEEGEEVWGGLNVGLPKWREDGVDTWEPPEWEELLRKRKKLVNGPDENGEPIPIWMVEEDKVEWQWDSYHPSIIPTSKTFLNYVLLLGLAGRASEIARVLAWMRHLKIVPSRSMLGASLVLWGEVCGRPILVERWGRRQTSLPPEADKTSSIHGPLAKYTKTIEIEDEEKEMAMMLSDAPEQYERLVRWLHEWVPMYIMPGPRSLARWTMIVECLRDGSKLISETEEVIKETEEAEEVELL